MTLKHIYGKILLPGKSKFEIQSEIWRKCIMAKHNLTLEQKELEADIWIIALTTFVVFFVYMAIGNQLMGYVIDSNNPIVLRLLLNAVVQFGVAGLGITVVCILRKQKFSLFGLVKQNTFKSIVGSVACFIPYLCYVFVSGRYEGYQPFGILITEDVLKSGLPINILGMIVIIIVWGFLEGFNYAVISDKLNSRYPTRNKWLDVGAITCAVICILFHPFSTSFWGMVEIITTFIAIYGMLIVKKQTQNAWGCVFVFCFIWNAI